MHHAADDLTIPDAPIFFIHGTYWDAAPSILRLGLSCRGGDDEHGRSRQFVHGCPYLPGDERIQAGIRHTAEVLVFVGMMEAEVKHLKFR